MSDTKSYYAIIPANVRYDKELTANAKLLYGEITALTNEKGYCWASNNYFADLYGVTPQAVSRWVNILAKKGYVNIEYEHEGKEITQRKIFIAEYQQKVDKVSINSLEGINKKLRGYQQKVKDNTTVNNISNTKREETQTNFTTFYNLYPKKTNKTDAIKKFEQLQKKGITLETILQKLEVYKKQIRRDNTETKYIRNPARFLNTLDDFEVQETIKRDIIKQYCKKCGEELIDGTCSKCYALHTLEGELI